MTVSAGNILLCGESLSTRPLRTALEQAAWSCLERSNIEGVAPFLAAGRTKVDLVIVEGDLPIEVMWALLAQATAATPAIPVLVLIDPDEKSRVQALIDAGAADCLPRALEAGE